MRQAVRPCPISIAFETAQSHRLDNLAEAGKRIKRLVELKMSRNKTKLCNDQTAKISLLLYY